MLSRLLPDDPQRSSDVRLWMRFFGLTAAVGLPSMLILSPAPRDVIALAGIAIATLVVVLAGPVVLRRRHPKLSAVWPAFVTLIALGIAGWTTPAAGPVLTGFYTMTYVYLGITRRPGTTVKLLPLGTTSWLIGNAPLSPEVWARLPIVTVVWVVLGELLAKITAERASDRRALAEQAARDALTGLFNRYELDARLGALGPGDSLVMIDLDHFKTINDRQGHDAGDRVLADLGRVVQAVLRDGDSAVRYGGEEILLLLPATDSAGADICLERLRIGWSASHPEITFSAGAALVGPRGVAAALNEADTALYAAKAAGRACTMRAPGPPAIDLPAPRGPANVQLSPATTPV